LSGRLTGTNLELGGMELKEGVSYIAYKFQNPAENARLVVERNDDLFFEAKVNEGFDSLELWKTFVITLPGGFETQRYLEVAPYKIDEEQRRAKFVVLGYLFERRKFFRFDVSDLGIEVKSDHFEGTVENVSLGGMKIRVKRWLTAERRSLEGRPVAVTVRAGERKFSFVITPLKVGEDFIAAKFEKPAETTSEFFYTCLKMLEGERGAKPLREQRQFRRFKVYHLNLLAETPLGSGSVCDVSLGGLRIRLKRPGSERRFPEGSVFPVAVFFPETGEEFILDAELVKKNGNELNLKIARWDEDALRFVSRILERLIGQRNL